MCSSNNRRNHEAIIGWLGSGACGLDFWAVWGSFNRHRGAAALVAGGGFEVDLDPGSTMPMGPLLGILSVGVPS